MSSYIHFYAETNKGDKVYLNAFSRSTEIYSTFNEEISGIPLYQTEKDYYELTQADLSNIIGYLNDEITRVTKYISSLEIAKASLRDSESIVDLISQIEGHREDIKDYEYCQDFCYFLKGMLDSSKYVDKSLNHLGIVKILCHNG
jgi:hypothetical protein